MADSPNPIPAPTTAQSVGASVRSEDAPTRPRGRRGGSKSKVTAKSPRKAFGTRGGPADMPVRSVFGKTHSDVMRSLAASGRNHVRPYGARDKFSRGVMSLVAQAGDEVKARIATDGELAEYYWAALRQGVKLGDSTCLQMYTKILKLVDEEKQVVVTVLHQLGMSSMEELERMVETHKESAEVTPEQRAAVCADYLELYLNAHPSERSSFVRRFGGEVPVRSDSFAVVEDRSESDDRSGR